MQTTDLVKVGPDLVLARQQLTEAVNKDAAEYGDGPYSSEEMQTYFGCIIDQMQEGDVVQLFDTGGWDSLAGRRGYYLIRNGKVVTGKITLIS